MIAIYYHSPRDPGVQYQTDRDVFCQEDHWLAQIKEALTIIRDTKSSSQSAESKSFVLNQQQRRLSFFRANLDFVREMRRNEFAPDELKQVIRAVKRSFAVERSEVLFGENGFAAGVFIVLSHGVSVLFDYSFMTVRVTKGSEPVFKIPAFAHVRIEIFLELLRGELC